MTTIVELKPIYKKFLELKYSSSIDTVEDLPDNELFKVIKTLSNNDLSTSYTAVDGAHELVAWKNGNTDEIAHIGDSIVEDTELIAQWVKILANVTASSSDETKGMVTLDQSKIYENTPNPCNVTALPMSGFRFSKWQDGNILNPRNIFDDIPAQSETVVTLNYVADFVTSGILIKAYTHLSSLTKLSSYGTGNIVFSGGNEMLKLKINMHFTESSIQLISELDNTATNNGRAWKYNPTGRLVAYDINSEKMPSGEYMPVDISNIAICTRSRANLTPEITLQINNDSQIKGLSKLRFNYGFTNTGLPSTEFTISVYDGNNVLQYTDHVGVPYTDWLNMYNTTPGSLIDLPYIYELSLPNKLDGNVKVVIVRNTSTLQSNNDRLAFSNFEWTTSYDTSETQTMGFDVPTTEIIDLDSELSKSTFEFTPTEEIDPNEN